MKFPRSLRISGFTSPGRVRRTNEDSFGLYPELGMALVSDGMGSHNSGGTASKMVVRLLPRILSAALEGIPSSDLPTVKAVVINAVVQVSLKIHQLGLTNAELMGMGATLVMMLVMGDKTLLTWMGDSRAYVMQNSKLQLITNDHSMLSILMSQGLIAPAEARRHPSRSRLSRYMGMPDEVYPDIEIVELAHRDRVLLCSDGLSGELDDAAISEILTEQAEPGVLCQSLVYAAEAKGGKDNITAVVGQWT